MTQSFGDGADKDTGNQDGFGGQQSDKDGDNQNQNNHAADDLATLSKRLEDSQAFIERLKTENADLRDEKSELSNALASATTLDSVIETINNKAGSPESANVDPDKVAEQVEQRLQQKANARTEEQNWSDVQARVQEVYGSWDKGNQEITSRSTQLSMSTDEATALAKRSPAAFYELFLPKETQNPAQSSTSSAAGQQTSGFESSSDGKRDRAYYKELRKKDPRKYWSTETQAQYRRDIHGL